MPESRRASGTGTRSAVAAEDPKTAQCSAEEWVSRVPDGGWGWLVVGGSFITTVSDRMGGYAATGLATSQGAVQSAIDSLVMMSPVGIMDPWGGASWLRAPGTKVFWCPVFTDADAATESWVRRHLLALPARGRQLLHHPRLALQRPLLHVERDGADGAAPGAGVWLEGRG